MLTVVCGDNHFATDVSGGGAFRPASTLCYPRPQGFDLLAAERIGIGRHSLGRIRGFAAADQFAFRWSAWHDRPASGVGRPQRTRAMIQPQTSLLLVCAVALDALTLEYGPYIPFKVRIICGISHERNNWPNANCEPYQPCRELSATMLH